MITILINNLIIIIIKIKIALIIIKIGIIKYINFKNCLNFFLYSDKKFDSIFGFRLKKKLELGN